MMNIVFPDDLFTVEKWKAFKGKYPPSSEIDHRIIIVCKHGAILRYFYVTSKVQKARILARDDEKSLVCLNESDWSELAKESCIQCDNEHLHEIDEAEFRKDYANGKVAVLGKIPENVIKSIVCAICSSKSFTDAEKKLYTV